MSVGVNLVQSLHLVWSLAAILLVIPLTPCHFLLAYFSTPSICGNVQLPPSAHQTS